ncbi:DUF1772 domain-containing protein [Nocardia cyriacigeorgica]|uniref:anthrone oxygenase family protein n=1 Tax=Nocardia cyriacigeorgica TaxID=135487 RepID=UPI002454E4A6|nr:DUF1772 domain-containing protein [Nocardia cyriacigeorgica]
MNDSHYPAQHHTMPTPSVSAGHGKAGHGWVGLTLGATLVTMALVAGLNFTFMIAVMPALAGVDDRTFVMITQRFNENPVFPLSFTAALLLAILATALQASLSRGPALRWVIAALALYVVVLAITGALHIPLNEQITRAGDPDRITDLAHLRDQFEAPWVIGNAVRTVFCAAAVAALARAIYLHGRAATHRRPMVSLPSRQRP